ncbi:hypothetical protein PHYC_03266 [Phycisphaerales bacterium]|nr:hypothetical protein PHYC_03266 [Phycisphaerales bacterium]
MHHRRPVHSPSTPSIPPALWDSDAVGQPSAELYHRRLETALTCAENPRGTVIPAPSIPSN